MKVVILTGGFGTRISEELHLRPKLMIEIGDSAEMFYIGIGGHIYALEPDGEAWGTLESAIRFRRIAGDNSVFRMNINLRAPST